tara:strand:+ start:335 stop:535 length:201 start_codon:yes stop_codon:yes gene_type:complete
MPKKRKQRRSVKPKSELEEWREAKRSHELTQYYAMKQQQRDVARKYIKKHYSGSVDATLRRLKRRR